MEVDDPIVENPKSAGSARSGNQSKVSASKGLKGVDAVIETEQKEESNPPTAEPSVDASLDSLSIAPNTDDPEDIKMDGDLNPDDAQPVLAVTDPQSESVTTAPAPAHDDDDYLDLESQTLATTRSRRQRTKVSYRDESSSEDEEESSEDSEAGNPLFAGLSRSERAELRLKMQTLQSQHSEQARKEREQALEEIVSSFEFNIGETVSKEEAGFILDFCTKHQVDVNDKIEDEGDFFLMSMREMIEERMLEIKNGIQRQGTGRGRKHEDSESEFDAEEYDDDSDDSEYDVDSDWDEGNLDRENLVSDDEYGGFVVGRRGGKRKRRKNVWVDKDGREYHCKGRLLLDDALKDTVNFEGWSAARVQAFKNKTVNPNAYYYRFNDPGEEQQNGRIRMDEHKAFMLRVMEHGVNQQWGCFSKAIKGRVGYQCSNYWRQMMKDGWVKDPNYWIRADGSFQFKRAKKGSIPDEIRRYSFVVTHDPSKVFDPLPGTHPKKPADSKLAKYLQTNVKALNEKKKKEGKSKRKKRGKKGKSEEEEEEEEEGKKKRKKGKESRKKRKSKKKDSEQDEESESKSSKKSRGKKRKHSGRKDKLEPPQKKRKKVAAEEEEQDDPMAVLKGMVDMMTGEAMVRPTISPYGHVMEYDSWCRILRDAKTKNRCPFTNGKITRRQLVKLDADNIEEHRERIVNITADQMGCLES